LTKFNKRAPVNSLTVAPHLATVGIGSNIGDREATVSRAAKILSEEPGNRAKAVSYLYETEPLGPRDQPWFVNCVIQVETRREIKTFFHFLQETESLFGRQRHEPWGPRTLDLDLLFFNDAVFSDSELTVPHPGVAQRRFVLEPLCEIAPDLMHPTLKQPVQELLKQLADPLKVVCLGRQPIA